METDYDLDDKSYDEISFNKPGVTVKLDGKMYKVAKMNGHCQSCAILDDNRCMMRDHIFDYNNFRCYYHLIPAKVIW